MSAESPRRRSSGLVLRPEPVPEKSFMESMAGLIHEVVPQGYGANVPQDNRDPVLWARFETVDWGSFALPGLSVPTSNAPLVLVLGYCTGVQVWALLPSGEAQEIFCCRQGATKIFKILPNPEVSSDLYADKRPLVALCDSSAAGFSSQYHPVSFLSLRSGEQVKTIKFKHPVAEVYANKRVVVATFPEKIAIFSNSTLADKVVLTNCYLSPGPNPNPVALGARWLAYAEKRLLPYHRSGGGFEGEGIQSYAATVIHAAKTLTKGIREFGETVASSLTGQRQGFSSCPSSPQPGVVTVIDLEAVGEGEVNIREESSGVVAHFVAHANQPIVYLAFDPSGRLLFTADKQGNSFHIFALLPGPCGTNHSAVHHLYTLYRGDTSAKVQDVAFSTDSRWVAVTTLRGTTHVFPITPYGGVVGVRTHTSPRVVNRLSRFHRSAGLDDTPSPGRNSPILSASPINPKLNETGIVIPYPNPRLPPYPHPTVVAPLVQLRSSFLSVAARVPSSPAVGPRASRHASGGDESTAVRVACAFATPRSVPSSALKPGAAAGRDKLRRSPESLFVMSCHGTLVEYGLEPRLAGCVPREKACDDSAIDLEVHACAQWLLYRPPHHPDVTLPLPQTILALATRPEATTPGSGHLQESVEDLQDTWLAQVEINTHAGPHRRLWMGPQFSFKPIQKVGSSSSLAEVEASELDILSRPGRSNPVNMPKGYCDSTPGLSVITGEGSASSYEQSPRLFSAYARERYGSHRCDSESSIADLAPKIEVELQLKENLAEAMMDLPSTNAQRQEDGRDRNSLTESTSSSRGAFYSGQQADDLLDFELEGETAPQSSLRFIEKFAPINDDVSEKDYSFYVSDDVVSSCSLDVPFYPDPLSKSAGESSSADEELITIEAGRIRSLGSCDDLSSSSLGSVGQDSASGSSAMESSVSSDFRNSPAFSYDHHLTLDLQ